MTSLEFTALEVGYSFRLFTKFYEAQRSGDPHLARTVLGEIEGVALNTTNPKLRARCTDLLENAAQLREVVPGDISKTALFLLPDPLV